ncbi:methionine aminotransferase [Undibacterium cyanobacteriorum]|uniref:Methionine aminotransferase n=1 Tax=Undibacterium cyanobacteriorum TaxID=3073561 RepID=A0ABY9RDJ4_9BURK|nr:methionine aminotransferase [Undibacterium sp. 20NA77.5]WMW78943.1 methionine aminotransferase [Undibacterium sp. 20NA77.5]
MTPSVLTLNSKLPGVTTTIFQTMSSIAQEAKAINLGQGSPDFDCAPELIQSVHGAMLAGHNQYPPMIGSLNLRQAVVQKVEQLYRARYDVNGEITITSGATQGLLTSILATVHAGDEVIVIEPAYDSYVPSIQLAGGIPVRVPMHYLKSEARFSYDWDLVRNALSPRTRMIIINSPHNPTGVCLDQEDLDTLAEIVRDSNIIILSDEVYEHMVFDRRKHNSLASHEELRQRTLIVSSFGKTYHVTGWKIGYVLGPHNLMQEFRKVHQFNVFTANSAMQIGIANFMEDPQPYLDLPGFYQAKRDYFRDGLSNTAFKLLPTEGSYFQCVDYSELSDVSELEFATWLCQQIGVAAIPISAFYHEKKDQKLVRFCFAKKITTLDQAIEKLQKLKFK